MIKKKWQVRWDAFEEKGRMENNLRNFLFDLPKQNEIVYTTLFLANLCALRN